MQWTPPPSRGRPGQTHIHDRWWLAHAPVSRRVSPVTASVLFSAFGVLTRLVCDFSNAGLLLPVVFWDSAPVHKITCMAAADNEEGQTVMTGCDTGEIVLWKNNRPKGKYVSHRSGCHCLFAIAMLAASTRAFTFTRVPIGVCYTAYTPCHSLRSFCSCHPTDLPSSGLHPHHSCVISTTRIHESFSRLLQLYCRLFALLMSPAFPCRCFLMMFQVDPTDYDPRHLHPAGMLYRGSNQAACTALTTFSYKSGRKGLLQGQHFLFVCQSYAVSIPPFLPCYS